MSPKTLTKLSITATMLAGMVMLPIPLLPPQRLVEFAQSSLGLGGEAAYLLCAIAVQAAIYGVLGLSATFVVNRAQTLRGRLLQTAALPLVVVGLALAIRSLRAGQAPVWINAAVPVAGCLGGVILGLSVLYRRWKVAACIVTFATGTCHIDHLRGRFAGIGCCNGGEPSPDCCCGSGTSFRRCTVRLIAPGSVLNFRNQSSWPFNR